MNSPVMPKPPGQCSEQLDWGTGNRDHWLKGLSGAHHFPKPKCGISPSREPEGREGERGEGQVQRSSQNSGLRPSLGPQDARLRSPRAVTMTQLGLRFWPSGLAKPSFGRSWEDNGQRRVWHGNGVEG